MLVVMNNHNSLGQPPRPREEPMDEGTTPNPLFPKSIGRRKGHQLINNGNTLQDCNKSPYRWRDKDPLINTTRKRYKHHI